MKVFIAAVGQNMCPALAVAVEQNIDFNCLESFFYYRTNKHVQDFVQKNKLFADFILDSGAFSYLASPSKKGVDWNSYVDEYADVVKENSVTNFIEMDIDPIVGLSGVHKLRDRLEARVGRPCIPVWHASRGVEDWKATVKAYKYCAIGGFVTREIKKKSPQIAGLLRLAAVNGCNVHGLGLGDSQFPFYSIDSSNWLSGLRYGSVPVFTNGRVKIMDDVPGKRTSAGARANVKVASFLSFVKGANMKGITRK